MLITSIVNHQKDDEEEGEMAKNPSKSYLHTGKNEDHIEIRGVDTEHSRKQVICVTYTLQHPINESNEKDLEEDISLKGTKPDTKQNKKGGKIQPEEMSQSKNSDKDKNNPFKKKITYLNASMKDIKDRGVGN